MDADSRLATLEHIAQVARNINAVIKELLIRADWHDRTKLQPVEAEAFDKATPKLAGLTYGSDEYKAVLAELGPALQHHYAHNRHHPEHHPLGIEQMNLIDVLEMFCDWYAATKRHNDGDLVKSIAINAERFKIAPQLRDILLNTAKAMQWVDGSAYMAHPTPPDGMDGK